MIVRIQGEGQWELKNGQVGELTRLDDHLHDVIKRHDAAAFDSVLAELLLYVREQGRAFKPEELSESDLILPHADATMDEVSSILADEGTVAG